MSLQGDIKKVRFTEENRGVEGEYKEQKKHKQEKQKQKREVTKEMKEGEE